MASVLFVCMANARRSPMAEVLFRDWLRRNLNGGAWQIGSAGTWAREGQAAAPYTLEAVRLRGLDLSGHRARWVTAPMVSAADLVVCMTRSQQEALCAEFQADAPRIELFRQLIGQPYDVLDVEEITREAHVQLLIELEKLIEWAGPKIVARVSGS
jgi:protein-tyrosine phosphatase